MTVRRFSETERLRVRLAQYQKAVRGYRLLCGHAANTCERAGLPTLAGCLRKAEKGERPWRDRKGNSWAVVE